jgi:RNA polymerase sigma-70 factor, ECF subfamily
MRFEEIYKLYYNEMKRFTFQLNIKENEKDDLIQDVFIKLYYEFEKNKEIENPRAWLYKTMLNQARTIHKTFKLHAEIEKEVSLKINNYTNTDKEFDDKERKRIVMETLNQMSERDKEILLLYYDGFSYSEIAGITEINPNSVGTTLVRAIEKFKNVLKHQYHEMFE